MAGKSSGRPVGRPKGTRTATVELETVSFKAPKEFVEQVKRYAKQRSRPVSELVRDGLEWRIGEGDPLNIRYGTGTSGETGHEENTGNTRGVEVGVEFLHGMLSALVEEVRQLRGAVQAVEQRLGELGSMHAPSVPGNTDLVSVDGDIPAASMKAQMAGAGSVQVSSVPGNTDIPPVAGDTPTVMAEVLSASEQPSAGEGTRASVDVSGRWRERGFIFNPAKHTWGDLCHKRHDRDGGQSVREQANNECVDCRWERSTAYKERKRAVKREGQPVGG